MHQQWIVTAKESEDATFLAVFFENGARTFPHVHNTDQILHVGARGYGALMAAPAVGALVGSMFTALKPLPRRQGQVLLWAVALYGTSTIVWGVSRFYILTFVALAVGGLADMISTVVRQTVRQLVTPDRLRGRMTSVNMIFFLGGPQLGELEAGFVAAWIGAPLSVAVGGLGCLVSVIVIARRVPNGLVPPTW